MVAWGLVVRGHFAKPKPEPFHDSVFTLQRGRGQSAGLQI